MTATHTNTAALHVDIQAAHYQMGVKGLHALLTSIAGKVVTYRNDAGETYVGHLRVSEVTEQAWAGAPDLDRVGFSFLVRLGESSDFTACGVWQDADGFIDLDSIDKGATISL